MCYVMCSFCRFYDSTRCSYNGYHLNEMLLRHGLPIEHGHDQSCPWPAVAVAGLPPPDLSSDSSEDAVSLDALDKESLAKGRVSASLPAPPPRAQRPQATPHGQAVWSGGAGCPSSPDSMAGCSSCHSFDHILGTVPTMVRTSSCVTSACTWAVSSLSHKLKWDKSALNPRQQADFFVGSH